VNRVLAATRLNAAHALVIFGVPWMVVGISFAINWAIWQLADIPAQTGSDGFTGGVLALYITVMIVFVQTVTQLLPFAMGISLSRRTFFLGTALMGLLQALGYGIALTVLTRIENATNGWGVGLDYWAPGPREVDNAALQVLVSGAPMLAFIVAGIGMGVVQKRWGPSGVWGLIIGSLVVFGGLAVLVTWLRAWGDVGSWLTDQSVATLAVGLPLALAAVLAVLSFAGLRRTVP
jgi:hypothetical protein